MTSQAPVWCLAIVVACLLQLQTAASFDHHAVQLSMPPFGLSKFGRLLSVSKGNKVRPPPVRMNLFEFLVRNKNEGFSAIT